jgi:hypothetical protein
LARSMRRQADLVDQLFNSSKKHLARILLLMTDLANPSVPARESEIPLGADSQRMDSPLAHIDIRLTGHAWRRRSQRNRRAVATRMPIGHRPQCSPTRPEAHRALGFAVWVALPVDQAPERHGNDETDRACLPNQDCAAHPSAIRGCASLLRDIRARSLPMVDSGPRVLIQ